MERGSGDTHHSLCRGQQRKEQHDVKATPKSMKTLAEATERFFPIV